MYLIATKTMTSFRLSSILGNSKMFRLVIDPSFGLLEYSVVFDWSKNSITPVQKFLFRKVPPFR